ncbi:MAG: hypothetical protein AVDCRST_MAG40-3074, partial [uncultured Gemmatimonadaceae bacterium]
HARRRDGPPDARGGGLRPPAEGDRGERQPGALPGARALVL